MPGRERRQTPTRASDAPEAWAPYVAGWRARALAERQQREAFTDRARREALRLAQILCSEFGATRVYLFGSLARGWARLTSDIDLAVEGLAADLYLQACARIEAETDLPVDLVDLREAPPSLVRRVHEEGEVLLERSPSR
ncbi:nucleotidyltransferase family protein [Limnochorda pilosa]|uniref:DNA polymerase subunit beta n=1 Tax=Limnochorda pilosa TaxID=1555112 RepID=A0A0K2SME2_LIMPI|nr:nucleotidyltransferase domain-containing protein [Limnochorda pilosa]BAS28162.1 DNA polymerase subunit beta [Limnochorda pilosa]